MTFIVNLILKQARIKNCLSLSIPSLVREGCHLKKKCFDFIIIKLKKWLLNDLGNTILNRVWSKLIHVYEDTFYKSRVPFTWYNIEDRMKTQNIPVCDVINDLNALQVMMFQNK